MVRNLSLALGFLTSLGVGACGHGHEDNPLVGEVVTQDDASPDEAMTSFADTYEQTGATVSGMASAWVAPAAGALSPTTPPTFEWTDGTTARHGRVTGRFVWLRLTSDADPETLDVLSIETTTFTPTATQWARLAAGATVTARLITAELDDARVVLGPFEPADATRTFTIAR